MQNFTLAKISTYTVVQTSMSCLTIVKEEWDFQGWYGFIFGDERTKNFTAQLVFLAIKSRGILLQGQVLSVPYEKLYLHNCATVKI